MKRHIVEFKCCCRSSGIFLFNKLCEAAPGSDIRLSTFNQLSGKEMYEALQLGLREEADAYLLDLRSNSGGLFQGAIEIVKDFIDD